MITKFGLNKINWLVFRGGAGSGREGRSRHAHGLFQHNRRIVDLRQRVLFPVAQSAVAVPPLNGDQLAANDAQPQRLSFLLSEGFIPTPIKLRVLNLSGLMAR